MSRRSSRDYRLGAEAGAVSGLAVGVLSTFYSIQPYGLVISIIVTVLEHGVRGLTFGAIFVWFRDRIPTRRTIGKTIIYSSVVWLVTTFATNFISWQVWYSRIPLPYTGFLFTLGTNLLWGAGFGYLLEHPELVRRFDIIRP